MAENRNIVTHRGPAKILDFGDLDDNFAIMIDPTLGHRNGDDDRPIAEVDRHRSKDGREE